MIYAPSLHTELMSTTALTPTQHKGGVAKIALIAAAIAIPFAAPAIATAIGLSGAIAGIGAGATFSAAAASGIGGAIVGGVLGAGLAAATGGDPLLGGLGGALGGGLRGFSQLGGFSGIGSSTPVSGVGGFDAQGFISAGGAYDAVGNVATSSAGLTTGGFDAQGRISAGGPFTAAGAGGPGFDAQGFISTGDSFDAAGNLSATLSSGDAPVYAPVRGNVPPSVSAPAPVAEPRFFERVGERLTAGVETAFSPENLAQKGLEAAGRFGLSKASEYFADEVPVSREEEQRLAFLDQQRAEQGRLQGEREKIATGFLSQARGISGTGQDESNAAKIAAARAGREYVRGAQTPALEASRQRQINLAAARAGGTAQRVGAKSAAERREALFSKAANTLPTGSALATGARDDLAAADERFKRLQQEQKNFSSVFGDIFLPTGEESEEERRMAEARRQ